MLDLNLLDYDNKQVESLEKLSFKDVAIIGVSSNLPMAEDKLEFWENLLKGKDCIQSFPKNRMEDIYPFLQKNKQLESSIEFNEGAYLQNIDKFDFKFFGISPKEASLMNPNQRIFLQTAWKTLEDAGYGGDKLKGSRTGVYLGYNADAFVDYKKIIAEVEPDSISMAIPGNLSSVIASRISYLLDFKGPAMCIDTACSSSLVALHVACHAIWNGDCDQALIGSVNVNILPFDKKIKIGIESSDGRARTFDQQSDGTGAGEGSIALLIKPLSRAVQDRDQIYAVIKGSAMNQDGSSIGITAPNVLAQEDVIVKALQDADVHPETVTYIEAHGTGTKLGDPIEIDGITRAFQRFTNKKQFCAIGSVKTNIGHLDNAAGIAGLLKAILSLQHATIPPMLHFNEVNEKIDFISSPVYVNKKTNKWEKQDHPRRAGVSSFGMSGTNCHVILEEAPYHIMTNEELQSESFHIFTISAKSKSSLLNLIEQYAKFVETEHAKYINIYDLCYTANTGRGHYSYRIAMLIENLEDLKQKLNQLLKGQWTNLEIQDIYYNNVTSLIENQENQLTSSLIQMEKEQMVHICKDYMLGKIINWELLYEEIGKKVSLPTYCFDQIRCWLEVPKFNFKRSINEKKDDKQPKQIKLIGRKKNEYTKVEEIVASAWGEVLGFKELKLDVPFYELGGDSILALKIVNQISQQSKVTVGVSELLKYETIQELAAYIENLSKNELKDERLVPISDNTVALTPSQNRLYVLYKVDPQDLSYNMPFCLEINGSLDFKRLEAAIKQVIKRHGSLRTTIEFKNNEAVQTVHHHLESHFDQFKIEGEDFEKVTKLFIRPFTLNKGPLIRLGVASNDKGKQWLFFDMHHIISDGISYGLFIKELLQIYKGEALPFPPVQYKDYSLWKNAMIFSEKYTLEKKYWLDMFSGEIPILDLPTDFDRPSYKTTKGDFFQIALIPELTSKIHQFAVNSNTTLYHILFSCYHILISKITGQQDIIVGTLTEGRSHPDVQNLIGMFVNTLAIRSFPKNTMTFTQFLLETKHNLLEAFQHQNYPFDELVKELNLRDTSRNPLFDTFFIFQNIEFPLLEIEEFQFTPHFLETKTSKFDLSLQAMEKENSINLRFDYCTDIFKGTTISKFANYYVEILEACMEQPDTKIREINLKSIESIIVIDSRQIDDFSFDF
ncbi:condensation domain-containing protein [Chengkuizengella sediminis]|uniref:condensation domain-containing protein n=1 Tax=Chengkuizengella sediminis TaxID=1885917 RepID=UPI00138A35F0|nr:condensation domain-containing protein [Chengkuizengella sediminis]NDI34045.1 polyketide synthase [Chengkuizengella sediminis]